MEDYVMGSKRLTPTIVGKIASKRLLLFVVWFSNLSFMCSTCMYLTFCLTFQSTRSYQKPLFCLHFPRSYSNVVHFTQVLGAFDATIGRTIFRIFDWALRDAVVLWREFMQHHVGIHSWWVYWSMFVSHDRSAFCSEQEKPTCQSSIDRTGCLEAVHKTEGGQGHGGKFCNWFKEVLMSGY